MNWKGSTAALAIAAASLMALLAPNAAQGQHIGDIYCSDGQYRSPEEYKTASSITAKGIVYWVDPLRTAGKNRIVALKDTPNKESWSGPNNKAEAQSLGVAAVSYDVTTANNHLTIHEVLKSAWSGKENTKILRDNHTTEKPYPAAMAITAEDYNEGWFLPSIAELIMLSAQYRLVAAALQAVIEKEGADKAQPMNAMYYSSSILKDDGGAWYLGQNGGLKNDGVNGNTDKLAIRTVRSF